MKNEPAKHEHLFPDGCRKCGSPSLVIVTSRGIPAASVQYRCADCQTVNFAIDPQKTKKQTANPIPQPQRTDRKRFECE